MTKTIILSSVLSVSLMATNYSTVIESPDATKMIKNDLLAPAKVYKMPKGCISTNPKVIARGSFLFHNLNGKKAKGKLPEGIARKQKIDGKKYLAKDKIPHKQYGNCVACHNIEGAKGGGDIGPDLTGYKAKFMDLGGRKNQFVFQKIADSRVDNIDTMMTINLTTKLFNTREICDIASYIVIPK
jgi:sulfur-oxidizing protein SoxX